MKCSPFCESPSTAILLADGFATSSLRNGFNAICLAGETYPRIYSFESGPVRGWDEFEWNGDVMANANFTQFRYQDHDSLFMPTGILGVDQLRQSPSVQDIISHFLVNGLLVAAMGHAVSLLADDASIAGRYLAAPPSLKQSVVNAGGRYVDRPVVMDGNLITASGQAPVDEFNHKLILQLSIRRSAAKEHRLVNS